MADMSQLCGFFAACQGELRQPPVLPFATAQTWFMRRRPNIEEDRRAIRVRPEEEKQSL
jgi:hypothetical protein